MSTLIIKNKKIDARSIDRSLLVVENDKINFKKSYLCKYHNFKKIIIKNCNIWIDNNLSVFDISDHMIFTDVFTVDDITIFTNLESENEKNEYLGIDELIK